MSPRRWRGWWRNLVHRRRVERDLDAEVAAMFTLLVEEKIRAGLSPAAARRAAAIELGGVEPLKATVRDSRSGASLDAWMQDIKYGLRTLRRTPGFAIAVVATLALGIGANTTIFTLLDAVMFKPLPVPAARELVTLYENAPDAAPDVQGGTGRYLRFSYPRFQRLEAAIGAMGSMAALTRGSRFVMRAAAGADPHPLRGQLVSGRYFETMGITPARGRLLGPVDMQTAVVAVISDRLWRNSLGGADTIVGQTILINGLSTTIVGVTPPGFTGLWTDAEADLWLPLSLQPALRYDNNVSTYENADRSRPWVEEERIAWLNVVARLHPATAAQATTALHAANQDGLRALASHIANPAGRDSMLAHTLGIEPASRGFSSLRSRFSDVLFALAAMVGLVLLVMCANIANLLLTRAAGRARDIGMRVSLGATAGRLVRQCLTESLLLSAIGGTAGVIAGEWASRLLARQVLGTQGSLPAVFAPDLRIALFGVGLSLATSVLFGVGPALRVARLGRDASVASNQRQAIGRSTMVGMRPLVAAQLALSTAVVFAAVLLGRTLVNFARIDPGFDVAHLASANFDPESVGYARADMTSLGETLVAATRAVPQVRSAAVASCGLMANCSSSSGFVIEGATTPSSIADNWVGPGFFATVGIARVAGREFSDRDGVGARVAIVNESMARKFFPDQNAVGRRIGFTTLDTEIIGVVRDARVTSLHAPPVPMVYFPTAQRETFRTSPATLEIAVAGDPASALPAIREAIKRAAPRLPIDGLELKSAMIWRDIGRESTVAYLAFAFAALALALAALGLYSVLAFTVVRRTPEIGVRVALGARPSEISMLVIRDALVVVGGGAIAGIAIAAGVARLLKTLLFEVSPMDPGVLIVVVAVLAAVTVAAAYFPARRAARLDPVVALRSDA